jgi:hypothetical protein
MDTFGQQNSVTPPQSGTTRHIHVRSSTRFKGLAVRGHLAKHMLFASAFASNETSEFFLEVGYREFYKGSVVLDWMGY